MALSWLGESPESVCPLWPAGPIGARPNCLELLRAATMGRPPLAAVHQAGRSCGARGRPSPRPPGRSGWSQNTGQARSPSGVGWGLSPIQPMRTRMPQPGSPRDRRCSSCATRWRNPPSDGLAGAPPYTSDVSLFVAIGDALGVGAEQVQQVSTAKQRAPEISPLAPLDLAEHLCR